MTGKTIGPYEILVPLGAGGMGEVYKARDTRLDRLVALKLLPSDVATDPERLARFEREARAASALNHPAIVTIYDVGSTEAQPWISMELVAGKTLRQLLEGGPLPLRRALTIAAQIAEGLAKAHEAGIVHRDLKPENVMVSDDGFAKILDFGLARLNDREAVPEAATRLAGDTRPGTVLGTLAYMSPEQASGAVVDFRADQFSFGAVLYEMLTGRRAFEGTSSMATLSAILRDEPTPLGQFDASIPTPVRWIVERTLEKPPGDRYGSTRDLARDLAKARDHVSELTSGARGLSDMTPRLAPRRREYALWTAAVLLAMAAVVALWTRPRATSPEPLRPPIRFSLAPPDGTTIHPGNQPPFELSPDGRHLVAVLVDRQGTRSLWVRGLDSLSWRQLAGTDGAIDPSLVTRRRPGRFLQGQPAAARSKFRWRCTDHLRRPIQHWRHVERRRRHSAGHAEGPLPGAGCGRGTVAIDVRAGTRQRSQSLANLSPRRAAVPLRCDRRRWYGDSISARWIRRRARCSNGFRRRTSRCSRIRIRVSSCSCRTGRSWHSSLTLPTRR